MKRRLMMVLSLVLVVALAVPATAQESGYDNTFDRLTNEVTFGGYFEQEFEDYEGENSDFDQHRTILFFGAQPHERLRMFSELEIEHGGYSDVKLEQAWLEFALNDNHNLRGGIDLIPVGRMNLEHDGNLRDFVFRPETDKRLIPTTWFESGASLNGDLTENLSYTVGISNGLSQASDSSSVSTEGEIRSMRGGAGTNMTEGDANNNNKALWGRVAYTPILGTEIGFSGYQAAYDQSADSDIRFLAVDFNTVQGPLELKGEYVNIDKDQEIRSGASGPYRGASEASGGYVEAAYHFFPDGLRDSWLAEGFDNPTFTALARHEVINFDGTENPTTGNSAEKRADKNVTSIGINYRPIEQAAFKASYDVVDQKESGVEGQDRVGLGMVLGF